ncbi:uncharacterized protein LOC111693716 [Trichogramma pretiosum]|uniref:uncharacterized protein LOC111693716 n=1 Tax=Trichogramma pretiosum TaxID=7493 RepID=UPI000C71A900|nr:uncharacterized protein LOC111693716 [Trichogramma pretiosum]
MEFTNTLHCDIRVKEEPCDVSLEENYGEMIDEKSDLENFLLLPFSTGNSARKLPKCDVNRKSELDDGVEIVVECEDVKPDKNLLTVKKIDDDFQYHLLGEKDSKGYKIQNIIKIESAEKVNQEFDGDAAEESNFNFECELVEKNKKRGISELSESGI